MRTLVLVFLLTTTVFSQEGIPVNFGTKVLPEGLAGETDIKVINQKRVETLQLADKALQDRYRAGLLPIDVSLKAQIELTEARLETTTVTKERLVHIENGLKGALLTWQVVKERQRIGARGGEAENEALARAAVFKFRAMWLKEQSRGSEN